MELKKQIFNSYIYGYLNMINVDILHKPANISWKEYKVNKVCVYLGLNSLLLCRLIYVLYDLMQFSEFLFSSLLVVCRFVYCAIIKLFYRNDTIKTLLFMVGDGIMHSMSLLNKTTLNKNDVTVVIVPFNADVYSDVSKKHILSLVSYTELLKAFFWSFSLMWILNKKYGNRDALMRYYCSFEYILSALLVHKIEDKHILVFLSTYTRWAYLNLVSKRSVFIQHGFLSGKWNLVRKLGNVDYAYYLNKEQKEICENMLFYNKPKYTFMNGLVFTEFPSSDKLNILLIGNSSYKEKEMRIIKSFSFNKKIRLFVKPHPKEKSQSFYTELNKTYEFRILGISDFPKVDRVISYESTLAVEYQNSGINVIKYSDDDYENNIQELLMV